jgi:cell division protein FtsB
MSAARSYSDPHVKKRRATPADPSRHDTEPAARDRSQGADPGLSGADVDTATGGVFSTDLAGLSIAGITRRHVAWVAAALLATWIVIVFARQVGDATAASNQAAQLALDNAALAAEVDQLQNEVDLIVRPSYVALQARAHQLGRPHEIPFTLSPSVGAPVDGAPGSASVRLGSAVERRTPLESWLSLLFGPG